MRKYLLIALNVIALLGISSMAFAAGAMLYVVVEELIPEAHLPRRCSRHRLRRLRLRRWYGSRP